MSTHTIHATITVEANQDERAKLQSTVDAGLRELKSLAARYGFTVTDATATVE